MVIQPVSELISLRRDFNRFVLGDNEAWSKLKERLDDIDRKLDTLLGKEVPKPIFKEKIVKKKVKEEVEEDFDEVEE